MTMTYGALDALSTQTLQPPPAPAPPTTMPPIERLHLSDPPHPIVAQLDPAFPGPAGGLVHATDIPGPPPASSLPGPSVSEATGAEAGGPGRGRLDPPATASGATPAAWAAVPAEFEVAEIARRPGTGQGASYPAPLPPPEPPGRAGAGAGPGFDRAAVGADRPGFARRVEMEIARRYKWRYEVDEAQLALFRGGERVFGWPMSRWRRVLDDLRRLHAVARINISAAAGMLDIDWQGIEMIMSVLHEPRASTLSNDFYPHG